jgi:gliding motility-associated-like protein
MESRGLGLQYSWTTQTGFIESGANSANPVISGFGTYYLEVTDVFNCSHLDSVEVIQLATILVVNDDYDTVSYQKEIKIPVMNNDISIDNSIDSTTLRITLQPINGVAYVDYDDYTIHYTPNLEFHGNDNFEYQICNKLYNCAHANVFVWVNDFEFLIPNAFSPNDDGINDYFEILGIDYFESNSITIINRSGIKVFETKNYGISSNPKFWDGKSNTGYRIGNEGLPSGTYFYVLRLGNGEMPISGSIYLDR